MAINNEGNADPSSIVSVVDFSLKNGSLNNYEPVKKLQNFIFKHRDFENIRFAEIKRQAGNKRSANNNKPYGNSIQHNVNVCRRYVCA